MGNSDCFAESIWEVAWCEPLFLYVIVSGQQFSDVSWERGSEEAGEGEERAKFLLSWLVYVNRKSSTS